MENKIRCKWAQNVPEIYERYHDEEWGVPVHDDRLLFEMLVLESFQAGLSWLTILKKREAFRKAFDEFDPESIKQYDEEKVDKLMQTKEIVRNRRKIIATIENAKIFIAIQEEWGSFDAYLWHFSDGQIVYGNEDEIITNTPLSDKISKDLKKRGMRFVGSTIIYAYLQAVGVVNDHEKECYLAMRDIKKPA